MSQASFKFIEMSQSITRIFGPVFPSKEDITYSRLHSSQEEAEKKIIFFEVCIFAKICAKLYQICGLIKKKN